MKPFAGGKIHVFNLSSQFVSDLLLGEGRNKKLDSIATQTSTKAHTLYSGDLEEDCDVLG